MRALAVGLLAVAVAGGLNGSPATRAAPTRAWADAGHDHGAGGKAKAVTVMGEVIDVACYTHDGDRGAKHAQCARDCAAKGIPVGILDAKGQVYIAVTAKHEPGASVLMPYIAKMVRVTGKVHQRGGARVIVIESVEEAPGGTK